MRSTPHSVRRSRMKSATSSATGAPFLDRYTMYLPDLYSHETSAVDGAHVRVAVAGGGALRERVLDAGEIVLRELDLRRGRVLLEVGDALRARDRDDGVALRAPPGGRELRRCDALLGGELAHALDELEVPVEV